MERLAIWPVLGGAVSSVFQVLEELAQDAEAGVDGVEILFYTNERY